MLKACRVLDIDEKNVTIESVKKQYRLKALYYHPDKNPSPNAKEKFQEVLESYEFLCSRIESGETIIIDEPTDYKFYLTQFFKNIIQGVSNEDFVQSILKKTAFLCEEKTLENLEKLDKNTLIKLYEIYQKNKEYLHLKDEFIRKVKHLISEKVENDECIILKPNINDLLNDNVYKLKVNNHTFLVPLWHTELVYDNSGNDIYVKCSPILDDNIELDDKNNLYVYLRTTIDKIWKEDELQVNIGDRTHYIKREELLMKTNQHYIIKNQGVSRINYSNIYDVSQRGDIIIHIKID